MTTRRKGFGKGISSIAFSASFFAAAYGQTSGEGSLYPSDVAVSPTQISESDETKHQRATSQKTVPIARDDALLKKALGPAAYILSSAAKEAFQSDIRNAIGRHPTYHRQLSTLDDAAAERKRARAALFPQLSTQFRGDYAISRDFGETTDNVVESLRPREQFTIGLSASQLVFDGGASFQRIKRARAKHAEYQSAISARINDLAFTALSLHHDLLTHQALVAFGEAFIARHEKILADVKERERLGSGSRADVTRARARLAAAHARMAEIKESGQLAEIRFEEFFGAAPRSLARAPIYADGVQSREQAATAALQNTPEIAVAAAQAAASQAEFKAAKNSRMPELRVSVDAVKYDVFDNGDDYDVRAGLNLNYNIFGGGARAADIAQARAKARQSKFGETQIRQETARDAAMAFERKRGAETRLRALENAVIAHDETRHLVLERYRVARGDLIDVLQAENDYFEAGVAYIAGLANLDLSVYALMEHTGDLLRMFSPAEEYADVMSEGVDG